MLVPPQNGPGPRFHTNFYESFYILDGEVEFLPSPPMDPESIKIIQGIAEKHGQLLYPPDFLDQK